MTRVENRGGRWYKRDDLHAHVSGVNGSKWRQCQWLVARTGRPIVTGASVLSPQHAMVAVAAGRAGLGSLHVIGGTTVDLARRHRSVAIALDHGAQFVTVPVGYNPALQAAVRRLAAEHDRAIIHYGITTPPAADDDELAEFHALGGDQVANLPPGLATLVVPFGSGNTAASVLYGLSRRPERMPYRVVLVGIGPTRWAWLNDRLARLDVKLRELPAVHVDLHGAGEVTYGERVRWTSDGIVLHPTYEGKVARWLDQAGQVPGWARRDDTTCLWVVGGPL